MKAISLAGLQQKLSDAIRLREDDAQQLQEWGIGPGLDIYRAAYRLRMYEALEEDFPRALAFLGREKFESWIEDYLEVCGSHSWTLAELGSELAHFTAESAWGRDFPSLADLVQLEWLHVLADHAEWGEPFNFAELSQPDAEQVSSWELKLTPVSFLMTSRYAVHADHAPRATYLLVYRTPQGDGVICELEHAQWEILAKIAQGRTIGQISEDLAESSADRVTRWFADWSRRGILLLNKNKKG